MLADQAIDEAGGLVHQLGQGPVAPAIGPFELQIGGAMAPDGLQFWCPLDEFAERPASPGLQVDLQQVVVQDVADAMALGRQQLFGGVAGAAEGGRQGRGE